MLALDTLPPPLAHWPLDEVGGGTARDSRGRLHLAGTVGRGAGIVGRAGRGRQYAALDGSGHYLTTSNPSGLPTGGASRTVTAWVRPVADGPGGTVLYWGGANGQKFCFQVAVFNGLTFVFTDGVNGGPAGNNNLTLSGSEIPPAGVWSHIALECSSAAWTYYLNGRARKSGAWGIELNTASPTVLSIGRREDIAPLYWYFPGGLADVGVYAGLLGPTRIRAVAEAQPRPSALRWPWLWPVAGGAGASLAGTAAGSGIASADLATAIAAAGSVLGAGLAVAGISSEIALAAAALGDGSASAALATRILLAAGSAGSGGSGAASAELATQVRLAAEVLGAALVSGRLTTAIRLGGTVLGAGTVRAQLAAHGVHLRAAESRMARVPARRGTLAVPAHRRIVRVQP